MAVTYCQQTVTNTPLFAIKDPSIAGHPPNHNGGGAEPEFLDAFSIKSVYLLSRLAILASRDAPPPCPSSKSIDAV